MSFFHLDLVKVPVRWLACPSPQDASKDYAPSKAEANHLVSALFFLDDEVYLIYRYN